MHQLKIGFVFDDSLDKPDGVQQFVLVLGNSLAEQGHEVHYLVGETKRTDLAHLHSLARNVKVRFNQNRMAMPLPAAGKPLKALLEREQFDVLHVQVPYSPFLAGRIIAAAGPKTAVVGTFHVAPHGGLVTAANWLLGTWVRRTIRRFDLMTATSAPAGEFARKTFRVHSEVVPNPVRLDDFLHAKPFQQYADTLNVLFMGRLVERKGCQYLLRAVAQLVREGTWPAAARVLVCGKGPLEQRLMQQVQADGLGDIVTFVGFVSEADKPRYLASADIIAYPSTGGESFGIVLLEGMAAGRGAVLAGDNPGYASVMAPHPESLVAPLDARAFARKLHTLLTNPQDRQAAHDWQRDYVRQFDISQVGARFVKLYGQALHKRQR